MEKKRGEEEKRITREDKRKGIERRGRENDKRG
jgi:hypothetical protein